MPLIEARNISRRFPGVIALNDVSLNIEAGRDVMDELEHAFRFNDAVLRHLTVQKAKAETGPSSMMKTVEREEARKAQQTAEQAAG